MTTKQFPEKWAVKITVENYKKLAEYIHKRPNEYIAYYDCSLYENLECLRKRIGGYFVSSDEYGYITERTLIDGRFTEISQSDFDEIFKSVYYEKEKEDYDYINPSHYKQGNKEVYEMMIDVWGVDAYISHCEMCAFKYRMRLGNKPEQPVERDLEKAKWYENKANELRNTIKK